MTARACRRRSAAALALILAVASAQAVAAELAPLPLGPITDALTRIVESDFFKGLGALLVAIGGFAFLIRGPRAGIPPLTSAGVVFALPSVLRALTGAPAPAATEEPGIGILGWLGIIGMGIFLSYVLRLAREDAGIEQLPHTSRPSPSLPTIDELADRTSASAAAASPPSAPDPSEPPVRNKRKVAL